MSEVQVMEPEVEKLTDDELKASIVKSTEEGTPEPEGKPTVEPEVPEEDPFVGLSQDELLEKARSLDKENRDKKAFEDKRSQELGELRKSQNKLAELESKIAQFKAQEPELLDNALDDPDSYKQNISTQVILKAQADALAAGASAIYVRQQIPEYDELLKEEIPELLKEKAIATGQPVEVAIRAIQELAFDPNAAVQIAQEARFRRLMKQKDAEIEKLRNRGTDAITKIKNAANAKPPVSGSPQAEGGVINKPIDKMSDEEVKASLQESLKRDAEKEDK